jgi:hypothetical protein
MDFWVLGVEQRAFFKFFSKFFGPTGIAGELQQTHKVTAVTFRIL